MQDIKSELEKAERFIFAPSANIEKQPSVIGLLFREVTEVLHVYSFLQDNLSNQNISIEFEMVGSDKVNANFRFFPNELVVKVSEIKINPEEFENFVNSQPENQPLVFVFMNEGQSGIGISMPQGKIEFVVIKGYKLNR